MDAFKLYAVVFYNFVVLGRQGLKYLYSSEKINIFDLENDFSQIATI